MKKFILIFISIIIIISMSSSFAMAADDISISQYIQSYYSRIYNIDGDSDNIKEIFIINSKEPNAGWKLEGELKGLFYTIADDTNLVPINKDENSNIKIPAEGYFITLISNDDNLVYICITNDGEFLFCRYTDKDESNFAEYRLKDYNKFANEMSNLCKENENGYVYSGVISEKIPDSSEWANGMMRRADRELGLIPGYLRDTDFSIEATRSDFCYMAYRLLNALHLTTNSDIITPFTDIDDQAISYLYSLGIVEGKMEAKFYPNDLITREEAATILLRLFNFIHNDAVKNEYVSDIYEDNNQISIWAKDAVYQMKQSQIMQGIGDNIFAPKNKFTLEQSVVTLVRLYDSKIVK